VQAIAVHPGTPRSMHLRDDHPEPRLDEVADGRGVLVELLACGVDGTDREILLAVYGAAPVGDDHLVTGPENLGRVLEVGEAVRPSIRPGGLVVATVRRPGGSVYDRLGMQDFTTDDVYYERGINLLHGFLTERYVDDERFLVPVPDALGERAVLVEPMSIAQKAVRQADEVQRRLRVWRPQRAVVCGAGPIGLLTVLALVLRDVEVTCWSRARPPAPESGLVEALGARYVSSQDVPLADVAGSHGPIDLAVEATGFSPLAFDAALALGPNGVAILTSVSGGERTVEVDADRLNRHLVLGNRAVVGIVNASHDDFAAGVADLVLAQTRFEGWLDRLLTTPVEGLERVEELAALIEDPGDAIKAFVRIAF
jgi:threonine dehydrogenase-like Zn-dependent dehydrogenase